MNELAKTAIERGGRPSISGRYAVHSTPRADRSYSRALEDKIDRNCPEASGPPGADSACEMAFLMRASWSSRVDGVRHCSHEARHAFVGHYCGEDVERTLNNVLEEGRPRVVISKKNLQAVFSGRPVFGAGPRWRSDVLTEFRRHANFPRASIWADQA
jgi:hypothetical protein